jgi:thiol-disulfide isomerase/thioredoxin
MLLARLLSFTLVWLPQAPAQVAAAAPVSPADCLKEARDFTARRQKELAPLTQDKFNQITTDKVAMQKACAAQFDGKTLSPSHTIDLAELYADMGNVDAATTLANGVRQNAAATRADVARAIVLQINNMLREPKGDERNARIEKQVDELDALGPAAFEQQVNAHARMNGFYRGDDIDAGIIKHSTWLINASKTFTPEQRTTFGGTIASAHVNMAQAWAGQGMTDKALSLLRDGDTKWGALELRPGMTTRETYFTPEIERLALVGLPGAAITAPTWFNGPASKTLDLAGKVTLLEFTAHWCGPCRESYPGVNRLRTKYGPAGFQVVLATQLYGYFESERNLAPEAEIARDKTYFAHHELSDVPLAIGNKVNIKVVNGKVEYDPGKDPNDVNYRVGGIPQIHLIDKTGKIRLIMVGYDDANEASLAKMIETLLTEK